MSDDKPMLPSKPHPVASAFFTSHDNAMRGSSNKYKASSKVDEIRNSLGWRTRYASATWYPVSVLLPAAHADSKSSITFHVRQVFPAEKSPKKELSATDDDTVVDPNYGTGNTVWPGSIVLLKYIERLAHSKNNPFFSKNVLDLGAGTAITTIAAALLGAKVVICTDGCDHVVPLAASNIQRALQEINGTIDHLSNRGDNIEYDCSQHYEFDINQSKIIVRKYLWGNGTLAEELLDGRSDSNQFDIIICADCIVPKLYPIKPLVEAINQLSNDNTITYLSYERRYYSEYDPAKEFLRLATLYGLQVQVVVYDDPMFPAPDVEVWKVRRMERET